MTILAIVASNFNIKSGEPLTSTENLISLIGKAKVFNPEGLSVYLDVSLMYERNPEFARDLISSVKDFYAIEEQLRGAIVGHTGQKLRYRLRLVNLPSTVKIQELTHSSYENRIAQFRALVTQVVPVRKLTSMRVYKCRRCHTDRATPYAATVEQMLSMTKRRMVYTHCGHCRTKTPQDIVTEMCTFVPMQKVQLQEILEETTPGRPPIKLTGYLLDDLANDQVKAGDQLTVVGLIHPEIKEGAVSNTVYAEISSYQKVKSSYEEIELTVDDIDQIQRMKDDPGIYDKLIQSFAPTIYGNETEKLALLCSLFGSPRLKRDNTDIRGDIHILLCGDSGIAKSMMIDWASKVSPRGVTASGNRTTGAGLTCAWMKGKDGMIDIEPGAMVQADGGGLVVIDEADKMDPRDRLSIHKPMEQQVVELVMAGAIQKFNSRCSVIAAANPKTGRYDPERTLLENIDLDQAFLARFDLVFVMRDIPKLDTETRLSEHMIKVHSGSSRMAPIPLPMLRKYIAFARRNIEPVFESESRAAQVLKEGYLKIRLESAGASMPTTPRQLEALIRIGKALARMQLSPVMTEEHARMALELYSKSAKPVTLEMESLDAPPVRKLPPNELKIWESIDKLNKDAGNIFIKKLRNMHPGREDLVDTVIQSGLESGKLESIDPEHVRLK
jgi:replicative DNA helicase Mcm